MADLHVFENMIGDLVVAESPEHAIELMSEDADPYDPELEGEFHQLPDEQAIVIGFNYEEEASDYGTPERQKIVTEGNQYSFYQVRQTGAEWAKHGAGLIGSLEF